MNASGQAKQVLQRIIEGKIDSLSDEFEDKLIARALHALPNDFDDLESVFDLLGQMFERAEGNSTLKGSIFKASARLDELAYGFKKLKF